MIVETSDRRKAQPLIIKIGGSLLESTRLGGIVATIARSRRPIVVVPGGGPFANAVRKMQAVHGTSDRAAHLMAMLGMHQMGLALVDMHPRMVAAETMASIRQALALNRIPVWLPLRLCEQDDAIPSDWSITSDGLAARLAERMRFEAVLLVKSRTAVRGVSAEKLASDGLVDPSFGEIVTRGGLAFRIIGPGEDRELAEICLAAPQSPVLSRRVARRPERTRRTQRRVAGGVHVHPRG